MLRLVLPAVVLFAACDAGIPFPAQPWDLSGRSMDEDEAIRQKLRDEIDALVGDATCRDVSECSAVAIGSKPCGGPWFWMAYSTTVTDTAALQKLVATYDWVDAFINDKWGIGSNCAYTRDPILVCRDGACRNIQAPAQ